MDALEITSPVGRLVSGSPYESRKTNMEGQPLEVKTGPNKGQLREEWFVGVAFEKNNPEFGPFWAKISAYARQAFPQFFDAQGHCTHPQFAWKLVDGDGRDTNGRPWSEREGYAGHWIVRFSSGYAPQCLERRNGRPVLLGDDAKGAIKRGYYVQVAASVKSNAPSPKPGLHVNLQAVMLVGYGQEIIGGMDAVSAFGAAPAAYLPSGMSTVPPAGTMPAAPNAPMMPAMPGAPMMPNAPVMPGVPAMPGAPAAPAMPAMPGAPMMPAPAAPAMPSAPAMPAAPAMPTPPGGFVAAVLGKPALTPTAQAQGFPVEAWLAQGYTEDMLVQQGIFTR